MKKKMISMIVAVTLVAVVGVGATLAYLTSSNEVTNTFTFGNTAITVEEDSWTPGTSGQNMVPGQTVDKDPRIEIANGSVESYIFMKVVVPVANVVIDELGTTPEPTPLFALNGLDMTNWTLISATPDPLNLSATDTSIAYLYKYNTTLTGATADPAVTTTELFQSVTFANVVEGSVPNTSLDIVITGYAIQAEGFDDADAAWAAYEAQN